MRYADNFDCEIDIPEDRQVLQLPVLSLLPLLENVVKHNMIDSENPMRASIRMASGHELVVSNPIQEKMRSLKATKSG